MEVLTLALIYLGKRESTLCLTKQFDSLQNVIQCLMKEYCYPYFVIHVICIVAEVASNVASTTRYHRCCRLWITESSSANQNAAPRTVDGSTLRVRRLCLI